MVSSSGFQSGSLADLKISGDQIDGCADAAGARYRPTAGASCDRDLVHSNLGGAQEHDEFRGRGRRAPAER